MPMQKAVFDCATGKSKIVDMTPGEEAALEAQWGPSPERKPSVEDRLAALEAKFATTQLKE